MGIFEKSIPRYTYDPIQKLRAQPVLEYYVDDIFDPLFNRSVKEALAQKYGNPLLGTVMGYYEGVENALFGQNDKWGILGPGMGILSGFGRSMDKAGDVILGSLTEGVKGVTGQGVENPLENIFVEDQDYTGRRALAAMANSMSRFAGGTTVSEEDFGSEFGPVSLGIELATDPSILGSNLTKIAKAPNVAKQLGSADNFLGDVGKFLQDYDDVMAKASIDITAPGLRPAIKALKNKLPKIIRTSFGTNFVDHTVDIEDDVVKDVDSVLEVNPEDPASVQAAVEAQQRLQNRKDVVAAVETVEQLDNISQQIPAEVPAEASPKREFDTQSNRLKRLRRAIRIDLKTTAAAAAYAKKTRQEALADLQALFKERENAMGYAYDSAFEIAERQGAKLPTVKLPGDDLDEIYNRLRISYDAIHKTAPNLSWEDYLYSTVFKDMPDIHPQYLDTLDLSPSAWESGTFVGKESDNERLTKHILDQYKTITGKEPLPYFVSSSEIGFAHPVFKAGNEYSRKVLDYVFGSAMGNGEIPSFSNVEEFRKVFTHGDFADWFAKAIPNGSKRRRALELMEDLLFPSEYNEAFREAMQDSTSTKIWTEAASKNREYNWYKQLEELSEIFRLHSSTWLTSSENADVATLLRRMSVEDPEWLRTLPDNLDLYFDARHFLGRAGSASEAASDTSLAVARALQSEGIDYAKYLQDMSTVGASDIVLPDTITIVEKSREGFAKIDGRKIPLEDLKRTINLKAQSRKDLEALENWRQRILGDIYRYNGSTEYNFLRKLQSGFDEIRQNYIQRVRGQLPHQDQVDVGFSINSPIDNKSGATFANNIVYKEGSGHYGFLQSATDNISTSPVRSKDPATHLRSEYSVQSGLLRTLQQIVRDNPQLYSPKHPYWKKHLAELYAPVREFAQIKMRDGSVLSHIAWDEDLYDEFMGKVMPAIRSRIKQGKFPFISRAKRFEDPELYDLLYSSGKPHVTLLNEVLVKDGSKYTVDLDKLAHISKSEHFMRDLFRQPLMGTPEVTYRTAATDWQKSIVAKRKQVASKYKVIKQQTYSEAATEQASAIVQAPTEVAAKMATVPPTAAESAANTALGEASEVAAKISNGMPESAAKKSVPKRVWHWFTKIKESLAVRINSLGLGTDEAGSRIERATLRTSRNAEIIQRGKDMKIPQSTTRDVLKLLTEQSGDVLTGAEFFDEIRRTGIVQASFTDRAAANAAYLSLKHNVDVFNAAVRRSSKDADALTLVTRKMSNGNFEVKVMFNTKNKRIAEQIRKNAKSLMSAKFDDVTFLKARTLTTEELAFLASDDARRVIEYLNEVNEMSRDQARMLGFTFNEAAVHNKHVRNVDPVTANYIANDIYNGIDLDSIDETGVVLSNLDEFRQLDRGVFGAQLQGRRFRGAYWNYDTKDASLFTTDLEKIAKGSLGDGMFANSNFQSFVDFFVNDNFKIHGVFEDVDDIRKFLYTGGSEGLYAGNLKNIDLCVPKYDSDGRIIGIHRFDQYSDADLAKALANPDTILVPANVIDTLDKVIRKEIRLSNKAYAFFNKHFTIPFKFGVITNPGFLVGNLNDAYLKQAVTMSEKYGTDVSTELAKVGEAATMYLNLGNSFNAAVEKWMKHMKECGLEVAGAEAIPEILAGHGPTRRRLMEYINGTLKDAKGNPIVPVLNNSEKGTILLWTKLQQIQRTSNSLREFDDFAEAFGSSDYDVPRNIVDRILQGSGKYSRQKPSTWGVITNNPVSRAAMSASEFIENTMRGTAIFNDLMHAGYTKEQIFKILLSDGSTKEFADAKLVFDVDYANAVNAMYEANFNYERMSDFMEGVGKAMPFPTFFLKNLTYWLTLFEKNPQFFDHAITVHESMWQDRDTSEDEVLAETKGRGAVPVSVPEGIDKASGQKLSKWFKGMFKPTPLQSMFGAFSLINDPVEDLSYRLHPAISGSAQAVNQALPHNPLTTFLGEAKYRPYSTDIYERNVTQNDEEFNSLAFAAHRANPYERAVSTHLRTPNKMLEGQAQLSDFLPSIFQPEFSKK